MTCELAIVVPVYNEADNVLPLARETLSALKGLGLSYQLLLVDDGSSDETWRRIQEAHLEDSRVIGLRLQRNSGQSAALWAGWQAAQAPILATLDGDLQNDPADIPGLLANLKDVDFVSGFRQSRQDTWVRKVSSRSARMARRLVLGVDVLDTGCALRVFRRECLNGVLVFNGMHRFLPILVHALGFTIKEVPVNHRQRVAGVSKYGVWNRLGRGMLDLAVVAWFQRRCIRPVATIRHGWQQ